MSETCKHCVSGTCPRNELANQLVLVSSTCSSGSRASHRHVQFAFLIPTRPEALSITLKGSLDCDGPSRCPNPHQLIAFKCPVAAITGETQRSTSQLWFPAPGFVPAWFEPLPLLTGFRSRGALGSQQDGLRAGRWRCQLFQSKCTGTIKPPRWWHTWCTFWFRNCCFLFGLCIRHTL